MKKRKLICIVCPRGCEIEVTMSDYGEITGIEGNSCKRGETYARAECTHPVRILTTTVRCEDGRLLPVRSSCGIPKERLFDCMEELRSVTAAAGAMIGDTVVQNILETGADIVVSGNAGA